MLSLRKKERKKRNRYLKKRKGRKAYNHYRVEHREWQVCKYSTVGTLLLV